MGRKFAKTNGESFAQINKRMNTERELKSEKVRKQWDDLNKYVPIYELNNQNENDNNKTPKDDEVVKTRKLGPVRNCGSSTNGGIRLSEIQKEVNKLATNRDQKRFRKEQKVHQEAAKHYLNPEPTINGAELIGVPPKKRSRNPAQHNESIASENGVKLNGTANHSKTFIELDELNAGPLVGVKRSSSTFEEETSANYFVTTPSDEENAKNDDESDEDDDIPIYSASFLDFGFEDGSAEDSEESYGIDLMEDSDQDFDEEEEIAESDLDFVADDDEIEEAESDELDHAERILEARRKKKTKKRVVSSDEDESDVSANELGDLLDDFDSNELPTSHRNALGVTLDEDYEGYESSEDGDFMGSDESIDDEEMDSAVSENEIDDLLMDITGNSSDGEFLNDSDEERVANLDPAGLKLKPMGLEIEGYFVDESNPKFVDVKKDLDTKQTHQLSPYSLFGFSNSEEHSVYSAIKAFTWIIGPVNVQEFFDGIYSKRAMVVRRLNSNYYDNVFPLNSFYKMFQENFLEYSTNINIAKYSDGIRTTHNPKGRVYAGAIRSFISQGMSVQCVNPQSFDKNIHYLCDLLQEFFSCFVGANCYYTPKGSSGFAPHYDDIDAFLIQTVGRKHWKVYAPSDDDLWPLESSHNFSLEEMEERKENLVFDGWLEAGDVLYMPRGFIHCAKTDKKNDSLHVTISVAQNHNYANLLEKVTTKLLEAKTNEIAQLRRNLPVNLLDMAGVAYSTYENDTSFPKFLQTPISLYIEQFQIGLVSALPAATDDIAREFMRKALPPLLTDYEKQHSIYGSENQIPSIPEINENTQVRLLRKHTQRLLFENEEKAFLIHRMENSMVYEGREEVTVDVPTKFIPVIEKILRVYPSWEPVQDIGKKMERNVAVVNFLYNLGILLIRQKEEEQVKQLPKKHQTETSTKQQTETSTKQKVESPKKKQKNKFVLESPKKQQKVKSPKKKQKKQKKEFVLENPQKRNRKVKSPKNKQKKNKTKKF